MSQALRRWAPWALLVMVLVGVLVVGGPRRSHLTLEQRTMSIAGKVRCPVCEGQSAAQSSTPASVAIRQIIARNLRRGEPEGRILDGLTAAYGPSILESPPTSGVGLWVWVVPIGAVVAGGIGLGLAFRHWRGGGGRRPPGRAARGDRPLTGRPLTGRPVTAAEQDAVREALDAAGAAGAPGATGSGGRDRSP